MSTDSYENFKAPLWTPRPVEETLQIYADWAATYDADVTQAGYATPDRIAAALAQFVDAKTPVLDFGCGTGLSGAALARAGFTTYDGVDISAQMLDIAHGRGGYRQLWQGVPGALQGVTAGDYGAIVAAGVVSLGAAPPGTLTLLLDHLAPDGVLAVSFNDPTLEDGSYDAVLTEEISAHRTEVMFREHGDHLPGKDMGSDVMILRRL